MIVCVCALYVSSKTSIINRYMMSIGTNLIANSAFRIAQCSKGFGTKIEWFDRCYSFAIKIVRCFSIQIKMTITIFSPPLALSSTLTLRSLP